MTLLRAASSSGLLLLVVLFAFAAPLRAERPTLTVKGVAAPELDGKLDDVVDQLITETAEGC